MTTTYPLIGQLVGIQCGACGHNFAMEQWLHEKAQANGDEFACPRGCRIHFSVTGKTGKKLPTLVPDSIKLFHARSREERLERHVIRLKLRLMALGGDRENPLIAQAFREARKAEADLAESGLAIECLEAEMTGLESKNKELNERIAAYETRIAALGDVDPAAVKTLEAEVARLQAIATAAEAENAEQHEAVRKLCIERDEAVLKLVQITEDAKKVTDQEVVDAITQEHPDYKPDPDSPTELPVRAKKASPAKVEAAGIPTCRCGHASFAHRKENAGRCVAPACGCNEFRLVVMQKTSA